MLAAPSRGMPPMHESLQGCCAEGRAAARPPGGIMHGTLNWQAHRVPRPRCCLLQPSHAAQEGTVAAAGWAALLAQGPRIAGCRRSPTPPAPPAVAPLPMSMPSPPSNPSGARPRCSRFAPHACACQLLHPGPLGPADGPPAARRWRLAARGGAAGRAAAAWRGLGRAQGDWGACSLPVPAPWASGTGRQAAGGGEHSRGCRGAGQWLGLLFN